MRKIYLSIIAVLLLTTCSFAQVTITNPANTTPNLAATYTSLAAAITALSGITAISGPVSITLNAGNPETAPAGGYVIQFTASTNAVNTITISGSNNTITASAALTAGRLYDGIFKIIGADYITIQNFTMQENPANTITAALTNNMTEWGVAMLHSSVTDGAQNNTIQNNTISLNRNYQNTFGIYSNCRHSATVVTTAENITNITGSNFGNKVYSNNISNVGYGIIFIGSNTAAFLDNGNDIGGNSLTTGNTITNWGEGATAISGYVSVTGSSFCIQVNEQINDNVSYNTITSAAVSGGTFTFGGILKNYSVAAPTGTFTSTINNNSITLTSSNASGTMNGIFSQNITAASTATLDINNNLIANCVINGVGTTSAFGGIINSSIATTLNISNNIIRGLTSSSVNGGYTGISNSGAVVTTINITSNKIGDAISGAATFTMPTIPGQVNVITNTGGASTSTININDNSIDEFSIVSSPQVIFIQNQAASAVAVNINNNLLGTATGTLMTINGLQTGTLYGLYNGGATATTAVSFTGNNIGGITHAVTGTGQHQYIRSNAAAFTLTMSDNTFTNLSDNISNDAYFLMDVPNKALGAGTVINNNSIITGYNKSAAGGTVFGVYCVGSSVNGSTLSVTNNNFSNVTLTGATGFYGIYDLDGVSASNGPTVTITGNSISNISAGSSGAFAIVADYCAGLTCTNNTVSNFSGTGDLSGLQLDNNSGQGTFSFNANTVSSLVSSATGGNVRGIYSNGSNAPTLNIYSNNISGLSSTGASSAVNGILLNSGPIVNVYDNVINNLSGSGTTSPTANGISIAAGTTLNVYRNMIYNVQQTGVISTTSPAVSGIRITNGTSVIGVNNNFMADLKAPNASLTDAIRGINFSTASANVNLAVYYNSVYINAASGGANFGTSGIYHTSSGTATTSALNMINNIIVNTSTANGTGVTAAHRRSSPTLTNFASASDYNLLYAGTPSATNLIFYDGTNSDQTLAAYQTRVSTRDANSISLMPNFISATDLHVTSVNCRINARGIPVAGITTDIDGATRSVTTPDIGADEFNPATSSTLAGSTASAVCDDRTVLIAGTTYTSNGCDLIARVLPSGADPVAGKINVCVTLDATQQYFNGDPYVQRHFDIEPTTSNQTTTSATITLYFTDAEFVAYNTNNPARPALPTVAGGGNGDANRANVKVTQFHGAAQTSPSSPGNYPGVRELIVPALANVFWNGNFWAITFDVAGFSGFYVHSNTWNAPLPVTINYFTGTKQGSDHLLNWKVTCNSTPRVTITLERSSDSRNFTTAINSITADAVRCQQPFSYTDTDPLKGMNYYRLKIVDADGKITYSTTVALLNAVKGFDIVSIAPNPVVTGNFILNVASAQNSKMELLIFDMQGRLVNRQTLSLTAGFNSLPVNVANLSPGTYTIKGSMGDDRSKVIRFVKQ